VRVPLNPLWPEPNQVYAVAVSALTDGKRLAVLLQWRDDLPQHTAIRVQDFQDGAAMQFSLSGGYGFIGMGDQTNQVNLWNWKAGWQAELAADAGLEMDIAYHSMHVDTYFQPERRFATAVAAGNVVSQRHKTPVEDANAAGFGSFTPQPITQQNVAGKGIWNNGFWNVVFVRDLKSREKGDVQFLSAKPVPVAFAVWNGEQGDRNGRKMVSNWYQLILDSDKTSSRN
jgi:DMSO reductase family type II enzyme heme b subunit